MRDDAIDPVFIDVEVIVSLNKGNDGNEKQANRHACGQADYIDDGEKPLLRKIPRSCDKVTAQQGEVREYG
jgi:hypothetical protein